MYAARKLQKAKDGYFSDSEAAAKVVILLLFDLLTHVDNFSVKLPIGNKISLILTKA